MNGKSDRLIPTVPILFVLLSIIVKDFLQNGRPAEYDERTWLDMLLVKHALIAAEKMKSEGDTVSGMTDSVLPSSYVRWNENDNA